MTMERTGSLSEWLGKTISKLKSHLAELGYSESTILRLDATWKELIVYCEAHQATEFTVDLERKFVWERYGADLGDRDICEQRGVPHLSEEAIQTIFGQPNLTTHEGRRDFAFLTLIYESAARASEIANLRFGDIRFNKKWAVVHLKGKGRKFRDIPVLPAPAKILKDYLAEESQYRQCDIDAPLFCNRSKAPLTRGGVYYIIQKYVSLAQKEKPDLFPVRVHPHVCPSMMTMSSLTMMGA